MLKVGVLTKLLKIWFCVSAFCYCIFIKNIHLIILVSISLVLDPCITSLQRHP